MSYERFAHEIVLLVVIRLYFVGRQLCKAEISPQATVPLILMGFRMALGEGHQ